VTLLKTLQEALKRNSCILSSVTNKVAWQQQGNMHLDGGPGITIMRNEQYLRDKPSSIMGYSIGIF
jgi:hypothetical protein